ncbi:MAG: Gfo/Idh/MocA family protein [Acidimicrobiales bacterium]
MTGGDPLRVGVIGATSWVATDAVLPALVASPRTQLVAVASRDASAAAAVTARFGAAHHFGDYESVVTHPEVEAVYVPLPNWAHRRWTEEAAAAGKHVLCEKPLAPTAAEAAAMTNACRDANVVLMEAYMTPFHPRAEAVAAVLETGVLGRPRFARSAFTFPLADAANFRWLPEHGGGALLDVGVYCLTPLTDVGGKPRAVAAHSVVAPSGVDTTFSGWLEFDDGFSAAFVCSFEAPEYQHLEVMGTAATLRVELPFAGGAGGCRARVHHRDGSVEEVAGPDGDPYVAMVGHFAAVVRGDARLRHPPEASVRLLHLVDRMRAAASRA